MNADTIIVHCSATKEGVELCAKDIDRMHRLRGYSSIGYHYVICLDGKVEKGRPIWMMGAHCNSKGRNGVSYNRYSIGICYIGGLDKDGKPKDTRTEAQKKAMRELISKLCSERNIKQVLGHRDTSPDKNGDGKISQSEWIKSCPCFDAKSEYEAFAK